MRRRGSPRWRNARRRWCARASRRARDLGGGEWLELELRDRIARGEIAGPRLLCAGQPVTSPGGHCHFWGGEAGDARRCRGRDRASARTRRRPDQGDGDRRHADERQHAAHGAVRSATRWLRSSPMRANEVIRSRRIVTARKASATRCTPASIRSNIVRGSARRGWGTEYDADARRGNGARAASGYRRRSTSAGSAIVGSGSDHEGRLLAQFRRDARGRRRVGRVDRCRASRTFATKISRRHCRCSRTLRRCRTSTR